MTVNLTCTFCCAGAQEWMWGVMRMHDVDNSQSMSKAEWVALAVQVRLCVCLCLCLWHM